MRLDGRSVDALAPKLRNVAMVFQSYALYPHMTVSDNIALPLVMRHLDPWQRLPGAGTSDPDCAHRGSSSRRIPSRAV